MNERPLFDAPSCRRSNVSLNTNSWHNLMLLLLLQVTMITDSTTAFLPHIFLPSMQRRTMILHDTLNTTTITTTTSTLQRLGWQPFFANQLDDTETRIPVRVIAVPTKGMVCVMGNDGIEWTIQPPIIASSPVVVGDWLLIHPHQPNYKSTRLKRSTILQRRAPGSGRDIQYMAANLDTIFIVSSCNQDFNVARLERYVAMAIQADITPVIVLTKADLAVDDEAVSSYKPNAMAMLEHTMEVVMLDARDKDEVTTKLAKWCQPGQTVAMLGSSGVGKSTLVNALCGSVVADTGGIRVDDGKGRHTTSHRQLFVPQNVCAIVDTPGMRELQLLDAASGVATVFADLVELSAKCRFRDCQHVSEPGCAIQLAINTGELESNRVARWRKLSLEVQGNSEQMTNRKVKSKSKPNRKIPRDKLDQ